MTNYYEQLRAKRNELITPVLDWGCELYDPIENIHWKIAQELISGCKGDEYLRHLKSTDSKNELYKGGSVSTDISQGYEILGKPVTLQDVLRMIKLYGDYSHECITLETMHYDEENEEHIRVDPKLGILVPTNKTVTSIEEGVGVNNEQYNTVTNDVFASVLIDLTKDIKDQDQETLKALLELIE